MTHDAAVRRGRSSPGTHDFRLEELFRADVSAEAARGGKLPATLSQHYEGELRIPLRTDRPTVIANFVSTLDGVVAFDAQGLSGGGEVSGFYEPDRFVMGLLRALADVVLVGAGTIRAAPNHEWTPRHVHRRSTEGYEEFRRTAGLVSPQPTTMVVTARGDLDPRHAGLSQADVPIVVVTTRVGANELKSRQFGSHVSIEVPTGGDRIPASSVVDVAARRGARVILCEGGPHLIGDLVAAGLLDELFLTLAPQVAGRNASTPRLALVEGRAFSPATAPWAALRSIHRSVDHLFLRYDLSPTAAFPRQRVAAR